jgi:hypothetical protein
MQLGRALAVTCRLLTVESRFHSWLRSWYIRSGRSVTEAGISPSSFDISLLIITAALLRSHPTPHPEICDSPDHGTSGNVLCL